MDCITGLFLSPFLCKNLGLEFQRNLVILLDLSYHLSFVILSICETSEIKFFGGALSPAFFLLPELHELPNGGGRLFAHLHPNHPDLQADAGQQSADGASIRLVLKGCGDTDPVSHGVTSRCSRTHFRPALRRPTHPQIPARG